MKMVGTLHIATLRAFPRGVEMSSNTDCISRAPDPKTTKESSTLSTQRGERAHTMRGGLRMLAVNS